MTLEDALWQFQQAGVSLIFTTRIVTPELRVTEPPRGGDARAVLLSILEPYSLSHEVLFSPHLHGETLVSLTHTTPERSGDESDSERSFLVRDDRRLAATGLAQRWNLEAGASQNLDLVIHCMLFVESCKRLRVGVVECADPMQYHVARTHPRAESRRMRHTNAKLTGTSR